MKTLAIYFLLATTALAAQLPAPRSYDVGFLAYPYKAGDSPSFFTQSFSERNGPYVHHSGTSLILANPDETERTLAVGDKPGFRAVHDWCVSLDGKSIYYSHIRDTKPLTCDIFRIPAAGGTPIQLTDAKSEWSPPSGCWPVGYVPKTYGTWNAHPCDTPEGLVFSSTRNGVQSPVDDFPAFQLFRCDHDGKNVEKIGHLNLGGVLHPTYWKGYVYFSTGESQGLRGTSWGLWKIKPDGTDWQPEFSAIPGLPSQGVHISSHSSDGTLLVDAYYDTRTLGNIWAIPVWTATPFGPPSPFGSPDARQNPPAWAGFDADDTRPTQGNTRRFAFQRRGMFGLLPWAHIQDQLNLDSKGGYQREVGHPSGAPGNGVLLTWTGDNSLRRDLGIYLVPDAGKKHYPPPDGPLPSEKPLDYFTVVVDREDRHEWYGKAIASYEEIYGSPAPSPLPSPIAIELPDGSPYCIIGSTSVDRPEVAVKDKPPVVFDPEAVEAVRVLAFNPTQTLDISPKSFNSPQLKRGGGTEGFSSAVNEKMGFYDKLIYTKKYTTPDGGLHLGPNPPEGSTRLMGPDGKPDSSWRAILPADQPWTLQLLNAAGEAIYGSTAQTWHQGRPMEKREDCQGCHNHWKPDQFQIGETAAYREDYPLLKLDKIRTVIYEDDIKPLDEQLFGMGPRPFYGADLTKRAYNSSLNDLWRNPALTDEQARLCRAWQDTGFLSATVFKDGSPVTRASGHGPWADTVPPTLTLKCYANRVLVGACDPQSGLKEGSLSIKSSVEMAGRPAGEELADLAVRAGDVWTLAAAPAGVLTVSIRDNQKSVAPQGKSEDGNVTRIVRAVKILPERKELE